MKIQIRTFLSAKDAVFTGSLEHGELYITPTTDQLGGLTAEQRLSLAPHVADSNGKTYRALHVDVPGWVGVVAAVDAEISQAAKAADETTRCIEHERASYRVILAGGYYEPGTMPPKPRGYPQLWSSGPNYSKNDEEAKRLWAAIDDLRADERKQMITEADSRLEYDVVGDKLAPPICAVLQAGRDNCNGRSVVPTPRATAFSQRLAAEQQAATEAREKLQADAIREVVAARGDPDQLERLDAGVLPKRELNELIEAHLFAPFAKFEPFLEITEADVAEECECETEDVRFSSNTIEKGELEADEYAVLVGLRKAAPSGAVIEMREHVGYQRGHNGASDPEIRRYGLRVTLEFAGREWRHEFAM